MENVSELHEAPSELNIHHETRLTSTELGNLWTTYITYTMLTCIFKHFASNVKNRDTSNLMEETLQLSKKRVSWTADILRKEDRVLPQGFSDEDLNLDAPKLYQDDFYLYYLRNMIRIQLSTNSLFLTTSVRSDVRDMYHQYNLVTMDLYKKTTDTMLAKGILVRPPYVTFINEVDYVKEQDFLTGFLGQKRPLLALEISSLHYLVVSNFIGKCLLLGFQQVAESQKVRDYLGRGINLAVKVMDTYESFLTKEDIPLPMFWDSMVTDSGVAPFSDKLMLFHTTILNAAGFLNIGAALSTSLRHDVSASYVKTLADIMSYAEDGANLMIVNGWLEEPPRHFDRREIMESKH